MVWGSPETRHSISSISDLLIDTPDGDHVRLGDVAKVALGPSPGNIEHEAVSRYVDIGAGVTGRNVDDVTAELNQALAGMDFPLEYHAELLGGFADRQDSERQLLAYAIAAAIGIYLLLQAAFNSWTLAGMAFVSLPLAVVGGLLAAFATGGVISLGALGGFLALLGLAARNAIMQVKTFQRLQLDADDPSDPALVMLGARERLGPVVTTAIATALALLPLVLMGPKTGNEILHPMAVTILGGLVTTTLVTLLVVPSLYLRFAPASQTETESADWAIGPAVSPASD